MRSNFDSSVLIEKTFKPFQSTKKSAVETTSNTNTSNENHQIYTGKDTFDRAKKLAFTGNFRPAFIKRKQALAPLMVCQSNKIHGALKPLSNIDVLTKIQNLGTLIARNVLGVASLASAFVGVIFGSVAAIVGALIGAVTAAFAGKPVINAACDGAKLAFWVLLCPGIWVSNKLLDLQETAILARK